MSEPLKDLVNYTVTGIVLDATIRESVDSLCRDATDTHIISSVTQTEASKNRPRTKL